MNKAILSKEQEEIVLFNDGEEAILVQAAAGSGKTRILTERVRYLLTEKKDKFFSVLCLTFTNKAADEMNERLKGIPKLSERAFIGNFHGFCLSIIRSRYPDIGFYSPPHIFDENDCKKVIEEVLINNPQLKEVYSFPNIQDEAERNKKQRALLFDCSDFISAKKRELIDEIPDFETNFQNWGEKNTLLFQDYNRRLREQNSIDYDDILLYAYRILLRPVVSNIYRRTYQYILIDEAQDLNFAQYNILRTICGESHKNVLMVGDPKQAIYGFNGSSPSYMQQHFVQDFGAVIKEINKNYRSSKAVLTLAEKIQPNGGVGSNYFDGITAIKEFENERAEAQFIVAEIKNWLKKGRYEEIGKEKVSEPISYKNIAVLARNKFVFSSLIELLEEDDELKTHFHLRKGLEKFEPESSFFGIFDLGTRLIVNPNDSLHFRQLQELITTKIPIMSNNLDSLLSLGQDNGIPADLKSAIKYWSHLKANPKSLGWVLEQLSQQSKSEEFKANDIEVNQFSFDLNQLLGLWKNFVRKENPDNQSLANFRYFLALNNSKEIKDEITLATVHTTKGLEFEIVFLMGLNNGVFPDYRAKTDATLKEEKNNLYVAITRAKRALLLTYPKRRLMPWGDEKQQNISRFLRDIQNQ
jgi:DNA helicase-2/ATP-dependent DNA helicase PcrA